MSYMFTMLEPFPAGRGNSGGVREGESEALGAERQRSVLGRCYSG